MEDRREAKRPRHGTPASQVTVGARGGRGTLPGTIHGPDSAWEGWVPPPGVPPCGCHLRGCHHVGATAGMPPPRSCRSRWWLCWRRNPSRAQGRFGGRLAKLCVASRLRPVLPCPVPMGWLLGGRPSPAGASSQQPPSRLCRARASLGGFWLLASAEQGRGRAADLVRGAPSPLPSPVSFPFKWCGQPRASVGSGRAGGTGRVRKGPRGCGRPRAVRAPPAHRGPFASRLV